MQGWRRVAVFILLAACSRPFDLTVASPMDGSQEHVVYVASQQSPAAVGSISYQDRPQTMHHAVASVAVPVDHEIGKVDRPNDPTRGFILSDYSPASETDFVRSLTQAPGDEIFLFVHGYNTTTTEAVMRLAQMRHDFDFRATSVVFSWASAASPFAYVYDRDSILFARDDLADLLRTLTHATDKQVTLIAHSLGGQLAMESLRQLALTGDDDTLHRLGSVILLSPDIDPDIFRRQVIAIGDRDTPYIVLTSGSDRALRFSSFLIGGRVKVGQPDAVDDMADLPVVMVDLSRYIDGSRGDHLVAVTSPEAIHLLRQITDEDGLAQAGILLE